ncbi:GNAT family N-acetyltransferase [Alkalicoccobacillus gibsonii]|uniref:GNAT family N-acetyltransferase n=1 Tax=Alkalicoccobacillus gibsonii TaxID=79881 RepID=UPI003516221B
MLEVRMYIKELHANDELPWDLLLEADPSRELVQEYLQKGESFLAIEHDEVIGVIVLCYIENETYEIKNISVKENLQGKGIGSLLIQSAIEKAGQMNARFVEVGTGNSSIEALLFYQKCGFRLDRIDHDFFVRNYSEKIFENGIWCRDMVRLVYRLDK